MARIRTVKPDFCSSQDAGALTRDARLFFLQLLTECDDEGRCLWIPKRLCGVLYPHDDDVTPAMLQSWADECASRDMVVIYQTTAGMVLTVRNWAKHQKISHPTPSRLEGPPKASGKTPEKLRNPPESFRPEREREREGEQGSAPRGFDLWWDAYPNKTGKDKAREAYGKALKKTDHATLLAAVEKQKAWPKWTKQGGEFIPNPATWLNQGRWQDELPQESGATGFFEATA